MTDASIEQRQRALLRMAFDVAVQSALPEHYLRATGILDRIRELGLHKRLHVLGVGKSAAAMAAALEASWPFSDLPPGVVVTRQGYGQQTWSISVLQAGHPLPDRRSELAACHLAAYLAQLGAQDHVIMLISGAGSALLSKPVDGVPLQALADLTGQLMSAGVPIQDLNIVRKHLSDVHGGKLARYAHPAGIDAIILSDVVGDDPGIIASGPVTPDRSTLEDARAVIRRAGIVPHWAIGAALEYPRNETPKPGDPLFDGIQVTVIPSDCWIDPIVAFCNDAGYAAEVIDRHADDDARALAERHARVALGKASSGQRVALVSGGEATVKLRGNGIGGPNAEYALQLAVTLAAAPRIAAMACDTDGTDGVTEAAGAVVTPTTLQRARAIDLKPSRCPASSWHFAVVLALELARYRAMRLTPVVRLRPPSTQDQLQRADRRGSSSRVIPMATPRR